MAGANLIYGLGMIESGMTFDYGQLLMDNEFAQMIKKCVAGIPVDDETLSVDVVKEIGPFRDFLSHDNTFDNMRVLSQPRLIDRRVRAKWEADGSTDLHQRALDMAKDILETHEPAPLSESVTDELRSIVAEAEKECGVSDA